MFEGSGRKFRAVVERSSSFCFGGGGASFCCCERFEQGCRIELLLPAEGTCVELDPLPTFRCCSDCRVLVSEFFCVADTTWKNNTAI